MIASYYDAPTDEGSQPMRGNDQQTGYMFSYVSPDERVPADHPLRPIRLMTEAVAFQRAAKEGQPAAAPNQNAAAIT